MYKCECCGELFENTLGVEEKTGVTARLGNEIIEEKVYYEVCPHCMSDNFSDYYPCEICGQETTSDNDICDDCFMELLELVEGALAEFRENHEHATREQMVELLGEIYKEWS